MPQTMIMYDGVPAIPQLVSPRAVDGNPVGTIISFMGTKAPVDYLICDGSVYNLTAYPSLAIFIKEQFGTVNYFGGDGTTTFAVPDLRNHFLRGYHGEASEQLSDEIGVRQEGTSHISLWGDSNKSNFGITATQNKRIVPENVDDTHKDNIGNVRYVTPNVSIFNENTPTQYSSYTSRPLNTAVLYCIKAVDSRFLPENQYSTEERVVGVWTDGRPVYEKSFRLEEVTIGYTTDTAYPISGFSGVDRVVSVQIAADTSITENWTKMSAITNNGQVLIVSSYSTKSSVNFVLVYGTLLYTKTTDIPLMEGG